MRYLPQLWIHSSSANAMPLSSFDPFVFGVCVCILISRQTIWPVNHIEKERLHFHFLCASCCCCCSFLSFSFQYLRSICYHNSSVFNVWFRWFADVACTLTTLFIHPLVYLWSNSAIERLIYRAFQPNENRKHAQREIKWVILFSLEGSEFILNH